MKNYLLLPLILCGNLAFAQLNETFNDDNLTSSPAWTGSNSANDFTIFNKQLRSNSSTASTDFYLSTPNTLAVSCQWEFWINLQFNPSSANFVDVYLTSNQENLQATNINGYFIRIGNTSDDICLYKRSGTAASSVKIIDGADGILNTSNNKVKIRVSRTNTNTFTLERDITGLGTSFVTEGTVVDGTFTSTTFFGIYVKQSTSSFFQKHFFDDFSVSPIVTDTTSPQLVSATALDSATLEIVFDEALDSISAKTAANYLINGGYGNPVSIKTTSDAAKYVLILSKALNTASYQVSASNVTDKTGNAISSNNTATFSYSKPYIPKKGDIVINEIFADPAPQIDMPSVEFIELYNTTMQSISLKEWKYSDPVSTGVLPADSISAGEYLILCAKADTNEFKRFGKVIGISPWPSLNNSSDIIKLSSPGNLTIDSVAYSDTWYPVAIKKQGGWSLERINYKSTCNGLFNWSASMDLSGGTPGKQNAIFIENYDQQNFIADSIKRPSDSTIIVFFNKPADLASLNNSFIISPSPGSIQSVSFDTNAKQATLLFSSRFTENTTYQLHVTRLFDCAGNTVSTNSFQFTTPKLPSPRLDTAKIFITEIFADPSPEIKLPLVEYIEIYNPGQDTVNLDGWTFSDPTVKASIIASIQPKEYLILCPAADTLQYKPFGRTVGISPWPSLNNASDQIALKSFKGRLVDSVSYQDSWHNNSDKKSGGWALERTDYSSLCQGRFNWTSSTDSSGGTPGRTNSGNIENFDKIPFKADSIEILSDSTVMVYLNKPVDVSTAMNSFVLTPASTDVKSAIAAISTNQITLLFKDSFLPGTYYQLIISGLKDCASNSIIPNSSLTFNTPKLPPVRVDTAKAFIMEIFADPSPEVGLPLAEFIEIYNPGKDTIDLEGWTLHASSAKTTLKKVSILPNQYIILCPAADSTQYKTLGKTIGISPWPALNNASGTVFLKSFKGRLIDSIAYADTWHSSTAKKQGGWSLERVDYTSVCSGLFNWKSSVDVSGGTPGKINSVNLEQYDKIAFKADSIKRLSDTSINVFFNKPVDISTSSAAFSIDQDAAIKSFDFDSQSLKATLVCKEKFKAGTSYSLAIALLKDCAGNIIEKRDLNFTTPKAPPVRPDTATLYITEIFADPSPEVHLPLAEFIEIYNPGKDTIDLDGWGLSDPTTQSTLKKATIQPQQYVILCAAADTLQYKPFGKTIGLNPWPSLNNSSDQLRLKSHTGRISDSVSYSNTWHKNDKKTSGGWSLERINQQSFCSQSQNWMASKDTSGGTPGRQNSVFEIFKNLPLTLLEVKLLDSVSVLAVFNRPPDSMTASNPNNYFVNNGTGKPAKVMSITDTEFELKWEAPIIRGNNYAVRATDVTDCQGLPISSAHNSTEFYYPHRIMKNDILISELLFNPRTGGKDFVEIFNNSKNTLDLKELAIASIKAPDSITSRKNISLSSVLFHPNQYLVLSTDPDNIKANYHSQNPQAFFKVASLPAFNTDKGSVVILSGENRIDQFDYTNKMHFPLIKDDKGISLERSLFDRPANEPGNFRSAAASVGHATPGYKNSQFTDTNFPGPEEIVLTSTTFSPDNDGFEDALQINYHFKEAGMVANVNIYDDKGALIKRLTKNTTLAVEGTLIWDGIAEGGQRAKIGVYIVYFEGFNLNGHTVKFRKPCVLAAKFKG
jgi:hypothetical protein